MHGFSSIFHARFHRKNERNPVHSFYGLVHSFLRRCWFISQDRRSFRKIFAFFASYSAIIFDGLALGWYILQALSGDHVSNFDVITNIDDNGYDFYITSRLTEYYRNNLNKDEVLGKEFAGYYQNITIPKCTYAIFETERCAYPTLIFLELRKKIASEWLPNSGYQLKNAPELVVTHWYSGDKRNQRYRELWIPIEKR